MNPLLRLADYGQSVWMDDLTREMLQDGSLAERIRADGLRGVTTNPSILHAAVDSSDAYEDQIREAADAGLGAATTLDALMVTDVRRACDVLRPVFDATHGVDGFVSLEVSPHLARETRASIVEGRRFARAVDRPNLLVKIPGTEEGIPAIEELLYRGIHVNVTLLFSVARYRRVAEAYEKALERRLAEGLAIEHLCSVASFFLSRVDVAVDERLSRVTAPGSHTATVPDAQTLRGRAAIASAKLAYRAFGERTATARWRRLATRGARPQRLLWASTSTKNPADSDVKYVEPLIGPDTVTTMPQQTLAAFADHGVVRRTLGRGVEAAEAVVRDLSRLGIDMDEVALQLESEGIRKFVEPYDALVKRLGSTRSAAVVG